MRYGLFSDIHGNLEALQAVTAALNEENVDIFWCLGDIVGYGANPNECLEQVWDTTSDVIAGNHDFAAVGKVDLTYFNRNAAEAALWTMQNLSRAGSSYLSNLPFVLRNGEVMAVHATPSEPGKWGYILSLSIAEMEFGALPADVTVCFVGHTHDPVIFYSDDEDYGVVPGMQCNLIPGLRYIINVGSVGQPRDGDPRAAYCVYDSDTSLVEIKRVVYDVDEAQKKIRKAGLPEFLATRLAFGQ
ncbi:MAG: metallophosphoesterase family protein [Candidatus Latescibacteria bacterium]|nr:metallophosphoesterase family protein [Candidatus Latescibacterota bacterium]